MVIAQAWLGDFSAWQIKLFCLRLLIEAEENTAIFFIVNGPSALGQEGLTKQYNLHLKDD